MTLAEKSKKFFSNGSFEYDPKWNVENLQNIMASIDKSKFNEESFSEQGIIIIKDKYCQKNERPVDCFARVAAAFASNQRHAQKIFDYISLNQLIPSTPMFSTAGVLERGLPISCYINEMCDDYHGASGTLMQNIFISKAVGGIGTYMGNVSEKNLFSYLKAIESCSLAFSSNIRKSATAVYLPVSHSAIRQFIEIREPTGGDPRAKTPDLHHGICISDSFMNAVEKDSLWELYDTDGSLKETTKATRIWGHAINTQARTGEPYMFFTDNVKRGSPVVHKKLSLFPKLANLCTEVVLPTGKDYLGNDRVAVCCVFAINVVHAEEILRDDDGAFLITLFGDNVLEYFIAFAPKELQGAVYSSIMSRALALGFLGFHTKLQQDGIPLNSEKAAEFNETFFKKWNRILEKCSEELADLRGPCIDGKNAGEHVRFSHITAIAPNATTSIVSHTSPGIEPYISNCYVLKTGIGGYTIKNPNLIPILQEYNMDTKKIWDDILLHRGSIQHLDLPKEIKEVYKTAFEIGPRPLIDLAVQRTPYISQSQSLNLFIDPTRNSKSSLHNDLMAFYKGGGKTLYYHRADIKNLVKQVMSIEDAFTCIGCDA